MLCQKPSWEEQMTLVQLALSLSSFARTTTTLLGLVRQPGAPNTKEIQQVNSFMSEVLECSFQDRRRVKGTHTLSSSNRKKHASLVLTQSRHVCCVCRPHV